LFFFSIPVEFKLRSFVPGIKIIIIEALKVEKAGVGRLRVFAALIARWRWLRYRLGAQQEQPEPRERLRQCVLSSQAGGRVAPVAYPPLLVLRASLEDNQPQWPFISVGQQKAPQPCEFCFGTCVLHLSES